MSTTIDSMMSAYYAAVAAQQNMDTAMMYESDNNKTASLAQIQESAFEIQQTTMDMDLQHAADLELGIETLDTSLQTSKMTYIEQMNAEENRHAEVMAAGGPSALAELEMTSSLGSDLPSPSSEDTSSEYSSESSENSYLDYLYSLDASTAPESGTPAVETSSSDQPTIDYLNGLISS
ncbi:MAG TPA: hypothetical protein VFX30_11545 [bacterium]|nr:hypothetical protein [bacterium]